MFKVLTIWNTFLTLPAGAFALIAPDAFFALFGVQLDAGGMLIARGYGATLVSYGALLHYLRKQEDARIRRPVLLSLVVFNAIEAIIQGQAGVNGVAAQGIFGNVAIHGVTAILCAWAWRLSGH